MDRLIDVLKGMIFDTPHDWLGREFLSLAIIAASVALSYLVWRLFPDSPFR